MKSGPALRATFDLERLAHQTYLTIPELVAYAPFPSENAAYLFLSRHPEVPKCRQGRKVLVMRRDYDRAVQPVRDAGRSRGAHV